MATSKRNRGQKAPTAAKPEDSKPPAGAKAKSSAAKKARKAPSKKQEPPPKAARRTSKPYVERGGMEPTRIEQRWTVALLPIPRIHILAVALLSLLFAFYAVGNIQLTPELKDSRTNFGVGITFGETGVLGPSENSRGWHTREPFVPFLIGAYHLVRKAAGLAVVPQSCLSAEAQKTLPCMELTAPYRLINVLFMVMSALCAFVLVYWAVGNALPAYAAYLLTGGSAVLSNGLIRFVTEAPAAGLMALVAVFLYALLARRRIWLAAGLGVSLAALTLTKIIFAYFWVVIAAGLFVLALFGGKSSRRLAGLAAIMVVSYAVIVGLWMTRNYVYAGDFAIMEGRTFRVLSVRASYNKMRMDEFWAGFVYLLPFLKPKDVERMGFPRKSVERFDSRNPEGFRRLGQQAYRDALTMEVEKAKALGVAPVVRHRVVAVERKFRDEILADPMAHLRTTILFAVTRNFPENGFGRVSQNRRLARVWGSAWPQYAYKFTPSQTMWFNAATTLSILLLPLVMWWQGRNLAGVIIVLPVYYSHALYAAVSHFNPRYAAPEIPLRNVALCVLVSVAVAALLRQVQRLELGKLIAPLVWRKENATAAEPSLDPGPETLLESHRLRRASAHSALRA